MSDGAGRSSGGTDRSEYHKPGNYYIMRGTWVLRPRSNYQDRGVVASIKSHGPERPGQGSINILWFPNSSEYLSARSFFRQLRTGWLAVDNRQHPYDKTGWSHRSVDTDADPSDGGDDR